MTLCRSESDVSPRSCPVCGNPDARVFLEGEVEEISKESIGQSRTQLGPGTILRCTKCGLAFREQRPDSALLAELYQAQDTETYVAETAGRRATARRHLRVVERSVRPGRLLDVGCASGLLLRLAADAGWDAVGVEPSSGLCEKARALVGRDAEVICSTLEESNLERASFDAVALWDVLEHVTRPVAFMQTCASLLRPDAHLFVNVPHLDSLVARVFGRRWPLLLPEHMSYFTRASLLICGSKAGLTLVRFGKRPAYFSVDHVLRRLEEHGIPAARLLRGLLPRSPFGDRVFPVPMGEILAVWKRTA